ncbi:MAG: 50S ribosomal protein L29 [Clostridiales bacterium]|nr:50S ribosomal protein L29 [Clostridiales bacterium]
MKLDKMREMSEAELAVEVKKLKNELFNLRFQQVTGQLENPIKMRDVRKEIARAKTVLREKELKRAEG